MLCVARELLCYFHVPDNIVATGNTRVNKINTLLFCLFVIGGTGISTQGLVFIMQALYHLNHSSNPFFVLVILEIRFCFLPRPE
jgi:hypothetical protein